MEIIDMGEIIEIKCPRWEKGCGVAMIRHYIAKQIHSHKELISEIEDWTKEVKLEENKLGKDDLLKLVNICSEWEKNRNYLKVVCGNEFKKCEHFEG